MKPLRMRDAVVLAVAAGLLFAAPAGAQDDSRRVPGPRLYLTGKATLEAAPDFASVSIGVGAKAATTASALDQTSEAAARIIAAAKSLGIAPRDLQTGYVSLQPAFRDVRGPNGRSEQLPDGYQASNSVNIRVRDLGRLGEFLRVVVDGGANRIGGMDFELSDPGKLQRAATAAAVKDAREQAEIIAEAAGVKLGRIEEIRYGAAAIPVSPRNYRMRAAAAPSPPVPVEAGSLDVSSEVQVVFAIVQP